MARALRCPACSTPHPLDKYVSQKTFPCEGCGQLLKVPGEAPAKPMPRTLYRQDKTAVQTPGPPLSATAVASREVVSEEKRASSSATAVIDKPLAARSESASGSGADASKTPLITGKLFSTLAVWSGALGVAFLTTAIPAGMAGLIHRTDISNVVLGAGFSRFGWVLVFVLVWSSVTVALITASELGVQLLKKRRSRILSTPQSLRD